MPSCVIYRAILTVSLVAMAGCGASPSPASPVTPKAPASIDDVVGDWTPVFTTSGSVNGTPAGCSNYSYTIARTGTTSAQVTYDVLCEGYQLKGTASALWQNWTLTWTSTGTVAAGTVTCPYVVAGSAAPFALESLTQDVTMKIFYDGTVCGVRVGGDVLMKHK
jgi:hypothetical protein